MSNVLKKKDVGLPFNADRKINFSLKIYATLAFYNVIFLKLIGYQIKF